jgi:Apea-like HEPN
VAQKENLLRDTWVGLDQADLRLLLQKRIGDPGQYDGNLDVLHLPLAREKCRVCLTYKGSKIIAIEPGAAFDHQEWNRICTEIEGPLLKGPRRVGREFSFSTFRVAGWWRGTQSGVQILPPPNTAPRPAPIIGDDPFILEFPIQDAGLRPITIHRRMRQHRKLTLLLNLLLVGTTKFLSDRRRYFWACVQFGAEPEFKWVSESYSADLGEVVTSELSSPTGEKLDELEPERYYKEVGHDGRGLRVPSDLDESICRYQNLSPTLQAKFDRAAYWLSMASRQWEDSMSASYASLVSSAEALTSDESTKHSIYCEQCKEHRSHDVPSATEKFRAFFEKYTPDPGLRERRSKMYGLRSKILHGSDLMQLDQGRAFGWDPPWWNEREMNSELWALMRVAARNWLRDPQ